jgi:CRP-like cAMP-binding protein
MSVTKQVLKDCVLFAELGDADLEKICAFAVDKQFESGSTMFAAGDNADDLFVIEEGRVAVQMMLPKNSGQSSRRITVDVATKGEIAGWSSLIEPYKYTFTAVCMQKTVALAINGNKLKWALRDNPEVGYEVMKGLTKVLAAGLNDTRQVLISERLLSGQNGAT